MLDTGIGIADDCLELIFDEFKQVGASVREEDRGLGLGLAITQRIARLIGASIDVASTLGRGSVFTLRVKTSDAAAPPATESREISAAPLAGACVVVIDNDTQMRTALSSLLQSWKCVAFSARSLSDALVQLEAARTRPAIVVADYHLDGSDLGTDAVAALRERFGDSVQGLIISNDTRDELKRDLDRRGFDFLAKPMKPMQLRAMLTSLAARAC